jgi:hypothetical protein
VKTRTTYRWHRSRLRLTERGWLVLLIIVCIVCLIVGGWLLTVTKFVPGVG